MPEMLGTAFGWVSWALAVAFSSRDALSAEIVFSAGLKCNLDPVMI